MRTKTLLLTAALTAAGLASATAQVFSVNAVGYVNITFQAGRQGIIHNPLNNSNNAVNLVIPLANNAGNAGSAIFRYDSFATPPAFKDPIEFFDDFGWFSASDPDPRLHPGEGFYFRNANTVPVTLTFVGEVPQGHLENVIPGGSRLAFRGSQTPRVLPVGDTGINAAGSLRFPAAPGDAIFFYDGDATPPGFRDPFEYFDAYGWFAATGDVGPAGPAPQVGQAFAVRSASTLDKPWVQDFSVN